MTLIEPSWDLARAKAASLGKCLPIESLQLSQCIGRVLATSATSLVDLPTYETSAMDGYAVTSEEGPWNVIGDVKAGAPFVGSLKAGEALSIATGAVIPKGTFGILRWEDATINANVLDGKTTAEKDVRSSGAEAKCGEILVEAGSVLTPGMVGLLAAAGLDKIDVIRKPKVALLLLGDEIQLEGIPHDGLVRDSLGPQLPSWLEKLGCEVKSLDHVADTLELTIDAISRVLSHSDVVVTTGGTADGPRDYLQKAIESLGGKIHINSVAVRPGHPQMLGEIDGKIIVGLPGNPQSAIAALMTLGEPLFSAMLGRELPKLELITCDSVLEAQLNFTRLVPGTVKDGEFMPGEYLGSAMLRSLAHAQGFVVLTNPATSVRWLQLPA